MGCLCTRDIDKESKAESGDKKVYSWDYREKSEADAKNLAVESLENAEKVILPGTVNGQQFLIQNCEESVVYVLDHMNTISIDDCTNCKFVLGPVKGSVYIRNCQNCVCIVACGQLRIRDSRKIISFVHSETQPVIEASSGLSFGRYQLQYSELENHIKMAELNLDKRNWDVVHDFTPLEITGNWKFIENENASTYIQDPLSDEIKEKLETIKLGWLASEDMPNKKESREECFQMEEIPA